MTYITKVHIYGVIPARLKHYRWQVTQGVEDWLNDYCYEHKLIVAFETEYWQGAVSCRSSIERGEWWNDQ